MDLKSVFTLFGEGSELSKGKWLIFGKGPSFAQRIEFETSNYHVLTLNDAIRETVATLAHFIDIEAVERCSEVILSRAGYLVMPVFPHFKCKRSKTSLMGWAQRTHVIRMMHLRGRLLCYELNNQTGTVGGDVIEAKRFSAEAAVHILAAAGVKHIRTLGVDGGKQYDKAYKDLSEVSLLKNGQDTFDSQFEQIAKTIFKYKIDYSCLSDEEPIKIFVAASKSERLPSKVLEYSIRRRASMNVEMNIIGDCYRDIPEPKHHKNQPRTPFSFQRFLIPELCQYRGRAIYLDSDMLVFDDIKKMWVNCFKDCEIATARNEDENSRHPQFSVMLLNCKKLDWRIEDIVDQLNAGQLTYESLMYEMKIARTLPLISAEWNSLEKFDAGRTKLLHYTNMHSQPWTFATNPLGHLWVEALSDAIEDGFITKLFVEDCIEQGHVRPSLMIQLEKNILDPLALSRVELAVDSNFEPPCHGLANADRTRQLLRRIYSPLNNYIRRKPKLMAVVKKIRKL